MLSLAESAVEMSLGDRMRWYETMTQQYLPDYPYVVIRVDGRAFHTFLRNAAKPFDYGFMSAMDYVAKALCAEIHGARFAYVQSDEVSVLIAAGERFGPEHWFGGNIGKMVSVSASCATAAFNVARAHYAPAHFDSRVFTLPSAVEVANYFLWRQRDWIRNSVNMAAMTYFSHGQLHGKNTQQRLDMLRTHHSVVWEDFPAGVKLGRVCVRRATTSEVSYRDLRLNERVTTQVVRHLWETVPAPAFTAQEDGWLAGMIPSVCPE